MHRYELSSGLLGVVFYAAMLFVASFLEYDCDQNTLNMHYMLQIYSSLQITFIGLLLIIYPYEERWQAHSGMEQWIRECTFRHATPFLLSYMMLFMHFCSTLCSIGIIGYLLYDERNCIHEHPALMAQACVGILAPTLVWPVVGYLSHTKSQYYAETEFV